MKTVTTLKSILDNLKETESLATRDLTNWPRDTKPGMEVKKAQALRELPNLRNEYARTLVERVAKLLVVGSTSQEAFVKEMKREGGFVYSINDFYTHLATFVEPMVDYGGSFGPSTYIRLVELIDNFVTENNLGYALLKEPTNVTIHSFNDLVAVIKKVVRDAYGDNLVKPYFTTRLISDAISTQFAKEVVLFTIVDLTDEERENLTSGFFPNQPAFAVNLTESDTEDTIKSFTSKLYRQVYSSFRKLGKVD